jgi:hypothetical protein
MRETIGKRSWIVYLASQVSTSLRKIIVDWKFNDQAVKNIP